MRKEKTKKDYKYIVFFVITLIVGFAILSDWDNFKAGIISAFN